MFPAKTGLLTMHKVTQQRAAANQSEVAPKLGLSKLGHPFFLDTKSAKVRYEADYLVHASVCLAALP